ncbi:GNAT family N-acetyltransferase [Halomonas ramblicola]|uniref:GNAT family N-acetyltransferase n=1 Tax=Halomonas ramblicola TaxID=747349 RepID=UPI0025B3601B|nr:GNAT family N-acetyltransferase [Halomonas ramblicola]MDN3522621.1 GNAT family N-acetyltransferase [Halomonas ramblicola]
MCDVLNDPATLLRIDAVSDDERTLAYARRLTHGNMRDDYARHGLVWDDAHFDRYWTETENYLLRVGDRPLGLVRLGIELSACYLRDLQIEPRWQRQGLGRWCLHWVTALARRRGCRYLRLRAFHDSAAVLLYQRHGLCFVSRDGVLVRMEMPLNEPARE